MKKMLRKIRIEQSNMTLVVCSSFYIHKGDYNGQRRFIFGFFKCGVILKNYQETEFGNGTSVSKGYLRCLNIDRRAR